MQMKPKSKRGHRPRSTPLGRGHLHVSISNEVLQALEQIRDESATGETMSHFVETWLRQNPQVKELLKAQEKGTSNG